MKGLTRLIANGINAMSCTTSIASEMKRWLVFLVVSCAIVVKTLVVFSFEVKSHKHIFLEYFFSIHTH